jgi:prophage regulatory protein
MPRFKLPETGRTDGFAREDERRAITGIATSTYYEMMRRNEAPRPIRIGRRAVAWDRQELFELNERRKAERDATILDKLATKEPATDDERGAVARELIAKVAREKANW